MILAAVTKSMMGYGLRIFITFTDLPGQGAEHVLCAIWASFQSVTSLQQSNSSLLALPSPTFLPGIDVLERAAVQDRHMPPLLSKDTVSLDTGPAEFRGTILNIISQSSEQSGRHHAISTNTGSLTRYIPPSAVVLRE